MRYSDVVLVADFAAGTKQRCQHKRRGRSARLGLRVCKIRHSCFVPQSASASAISRAKAPGLANALARSSATACHIRVQFKLMTSWALVADIYFLPPQKIWEGESGADFANRVQAMIADVAKLRPVPWDGYLKYYNLADRVRASAHQCFLVVAGSRFSVMRHDAVLLLSRVRH